MYDTELRRRKFDSSFTAGMCLGRDTGSDAHQSVRPRSELWSSQLADTLQ